MIGIGIGVLCLALCCGLLAGGLKALLEQSEKDRKALDDLQARVFRLEAYLIDHELRLQSAARILRERG